MKKIEELTLGVDCGGTNLKIALVNENGQMLQSALEPINFKRPAGQVVADIASRIKNFTGLHLINFPIWK